MTTAPLPQVGTKAATASKDGIMQAFVARQPIFDRDLNAAGYELLFRSGFENAFGGVDGDQASTTVIADSFLTFGLEQLTVGRRAYINFPRRALCSDLPWLLPPETLVVEILESVAPDPEVIAACRKLRAGGYRLALDDVTSLERVRQFEGEYDIVKVDLMHASPEVVPYFVEELRPQGKLLLAEKVETLADYADVKAMGYDLFQGYFFSMPVIMSRRRVVETHPSRLALLQVVHRRDVDFGQIEEIIRQDVGLTYRLLKYINSAFFSVRERVGSIRQALVLLGMKNIRRWASLIAIEALGEGKPSELMTASITRARFLEGLAEPAGLKSRQDDLFLLGMFSLLDAVLDRPMADVLAEIPLEDDLRDALSGEDNLLRRLLDLVSAYEHADWDATRNACEMIPLEEAALPPLYIESLEYAESILHGVSD